MKLTENDITNNIIKKIGVYINKKIDEESVTATELLKSYNSLILEIMVIVRMETFDYELMKLRCMEGTKIIQEEIEINRNTPLITEASKLLNNLNVINKAKLEILLDPRNTSRFRDG